MEQEYISFKKAEEILAKKKKPYSRVYLSLLARQGKLKAIKLANEWMTTENWLNQFLENQKLKINQKTAKKMAVLESSNSARKSGLSTYNQYSKAKNFVKSKTVDNSKTVEMEGIEPPDSWLISQSSRQAIPTASLLYQKKKKKLNTKDLRIDTNIRIKQNTKKKKIKEREIILPFYFGWALRMRFAFIKGYHSYIRKVFGIRRWWQEAVALVLLVAMVGSGFWFYPTRTALGATYYWVQTDWSGGLDGGTYPVHPTNQTNWTKYNAKDSGTTASNELTLTITSGSWTQTTDEDFNAGTPSNITVSGGNVILADESFSWSAKSEWDNLVEQVMLMRIQVQLIVLHGQENLPGTFLILLKEILFLFLSLLI